MEKIYRFAAKNKTLFTVLSIVFLCGVYTTFFAFLGLPLWMIILANLVFLFVSWAYPEVARGKLMDKAIAILHQECDPEPLLQEVQTQLTYRNSPAQEQLLLINKAVALGMLGQQQEYEILTSINIDKSPATLPPTKFIYYNNLSSACISLGDVEQAKIWNTKARQLYADMKDGKPKESLRHQYQMLQADSCFLNREYEKALDLVRTLPAENLYQQVCKAFFCAEIQLKQGKQETVKEYLQFVITNGNKLHCVMKAQDLMKQYDL